MYKTDFSIDRKLIKEVTSHANYYSERYKNNLDSSRRISLELAVDDLKNLSRIIEEPNHNYWPSIEPSIIRFAERGINFQVKSLLFQLKHAKSPLDENKDRLYHALKKIEKLDYILFAVIREADRFKPYTRAEIEA